MRRRVSLVAVLMIVSIVAGLIGACNSAPAATPTSAPQPTNPPQPTAVPTPKPAVTVAPMGPITPNKKYVMAFANWNETNSFAVLVRKGVERVAAEYGVTIISMDNKQDPQQANTNADNAITQKVDFYFQYNQDAEINTRVADKLKAAGTKGIGIQVPMGDFPLYRVDNVLAGTLGGRGLAEKAKATWSEEPIMLVMGYPEAGALFQSRAAGAIAGAKSILPNVKVFEDTTKGDPERCRQVVADFLTAHPKEKIILWTHVDQMALASLSAVKTSNRLNDVFIAQTGGDPSIFPELRNPDSIIVGTASFFPELWGEDLVPLAIKWLNDGTMPPPIMEPRTMLLNNQNITEFYPE